RGGWSLDDEGETFVLKRRDHHGQRQAWLVALRLSVERLAEFHDVEASLSECGTDGRARICLACRHLQFHEADDFLCQLTLLLGPNGCSSHPPHFCRQRSGCHCGGTEGFFASPRRRRDRSTTRLTQDQTKA